MSLCRVQPVSPTFLLKDRLEYSVPRKRSTYVPWLAWLPLSNAEQRRSRYH